MLFSLTRFCVRSIRRDAALKSGACKTEAVDMAEAMNMRWALGRALILAFAVLWAAPGAVFAASAPAVTNVRIGTFDGFTRVVVRTNAPLSPKLFTLGGPDRLIIDLPEVEWQIAAPKGNVDSRLIRGFRFGLFEPGVSRLVLSLSGPARVDQFDQRTLDGGRSFEFDIRLNEIDAAQPFSRAANAPRFSGNALRPSRLPNARLVDEETRQQFGNRGFDPEAADFGALGSLLAALNGVEPKAEDAPETLVEEKLVPKPSEHAALAGTARPLILFKAPPREEISPETARPEMTSPRPAERSDHKHTAKPIRIMLDAGHGGKDPGTAPAGIGVTEKEVNLLFTLALKALIEVDPAYEVFLSRDDDSFVSLPDRVAKAKAHNADLMLSIHADWFHDPTIKGATAYTLSEEASIRTTDRIVSDRDGDQTVAGIHVSEEREDVVRVLLDLARRETQTRSRSFGELVVEEFEAVTPVVRGVRNHDLHVLRTADLPAVLIELGYMSNVDDRALLQSEEWRQKTAKAVKRALDRWRIERGMREFARR